MTTRKLQVYWTFRSQLARHFRESVRSSGISKCRPHLIKNVQLNFLMWVFMKLSLHISQLPILPTTYEIVSSYYQILNVCCVIGNCVARWSLSNWCSLLSEEYWHEKTTSNRCICVNGNWWWAVLSLCW